jgi:hypothetical protein
MTQAQFSDEWDDEPTVREIWERLPGEQAPPVHTGNWPVPDATILAIFRADPKATHRDLPALR